MTPWTLLIVVLAAVPVTTVALAPRAWLKPGILLALVSPVIAYCGIIAWEMLTRPPEPNALGLAVSGFMLVSAFLTVPWLLICGAGFAIGFGIRRIMRGPRDREPAPDEIAVTPSSTLAARAVLADAPPPIAGRMTDLAAATDGARTTFQSSEPTPFYRDISPDGSIRVDRDAKEWGNSHWVYSPRVIEIATGRVVLDLWDTDWDADVSFPRERCVHLFFRRYHVGGALAVDLDLSRQTYQIIMEPGHDGALLPAPLSDIANGLEAASIRSVSVKGATRLAPISPRPAVAWRAGLLILAGALFAVSAATYWSMHDAPAPARKPTQTPKVPDARPIVVPRHDTTTNKRP